MFNDFGESAKIALNSATTLSEKLNHSYLGTEHLFLGVMELEGFDIQGPLGKAGVKADHIVDEVKKEMEGRSRRSNNDRILLTQRTERVLRYAAEENGCAEGKKVEAPSLIIGILRDGKGLPARVLEKNGVDLGQLAGELRAMVARGDWSPKAYEKTQDTFFLSFKPPSELMESIGVDFTQMASEGKLDPVIGREIETLKLIQVLLSRKKSNAILVGDAGVGKTAIVEGLAQLLASGCAPPELQGRRLRTIEVGALVAGTMYRGTFEQKLVDLVKEAKENSEELILFIDEIHMLVGAGRSSGSDIDAADILKPALARGDFKCIGATTMAEAKKYIESDAALARRFQTIYIKESSKKDTLDILRGLRSRYEEFHNVKILDDALKAAVDLSVKHIPDRHLPDKAIDLMDQACSFRRIGAHYGHDQVDNVTETAGDGKFCWNTEEAEPTIMLIAPKDVDSVITNWIKTPIGKERKKKRKKYLFMRV